MSEGVKMFCGEWKQRVAQLETERAEQLAVRRALDRSTAVVELSPDGVVLAATAGAINVRLGGEALRARADLQTPQGLEIEADMGDSDSTPGREPEVGHLRSVVGLVWRSVVVWMLLLALLTLARLLG